MAPTRNKLLALYWCLHLWTLYAESVRPLRATATVVPVSTVPNQTTTPGKDEWWTEDHPYMYKYRYKRLANGSLVLNQEAGEKVTFKKIREAAAANQSPALAFMASRKNRKTLRSVYQYILMNFVPPMAHGSDVKRAHIKKLQSKMLRNYFIRSIAIPGVKLIGSLIFDAIKLHYGSYIERKMLFKRMETMSLEEICAELNVTPPVYDAEAYFDAHRPNYTLPYEPKGYIHAFREYAMVFEPYANYSLIYYSLDEDLPAPVLPAASYPWRWRRQLAETRDLVLQVMALTADVQVLEPDVQLLNDNEFYAYPCMDSSMVLTPRNSSSSSEFQSARVNCSVAAPCLVQSGVTVFTPQLRTLSFFEQVVRNPAGSSKEQQRQTRVQILQNMTRIAFEAEQKALEAGVQAPSTVWYSLFDYNVDQFADALQGQVRATWHSKPDGANASAREVFTTLVADKQRSLFHSVSSYYWSTLRDTNRVMLISRTMPMLEALTEAEQITLLTTVAAKMKDLDAAIAAFVEKRAADEEYRQVVNATVSRAEYEGNQYSTLGFGFLLPATNTKNVLYRDLRLPEPFHLALRLLVRIQESRLLLPDESFHIVACLAMLRSEISYYRCRPASP